MKKAFFFLSIISSVLFYSCSKDANSVSDSGTGKGGSLARFTISGNFLYVVDNENLTVFDISDPAQPKYMNLIKVGFGIETIYPFDGKLFIGSNSAMYIYDASDGSNPTKLGEASHLRSCDPVVANDSIAFVTVRGGSSCGGNLNALLVYDIRNLMSPYEIARVDLSAPMGLALKDSMLYICDGNVGIRTYNVLNPSAPKSVQVTPGEFAMDLITLDQTMLAMLKDGMAYYDISNPANIKKITVIK
jgi:hypothetical protein